MKIALASDLHFEFHKRERDWLPEIAADCDVILLAGDIGVGSGAAIAAFKIADAYPESHIVWVAGNHEFYRREIDNQINEYSHMCAESDRVHYLENDAVEINGYQFLGCTLWTDFSSLGENNILRAKEAAELDIADFSLIKKGADGNLFTAGDAANKFGESCEWLKTNLENSPPEKTIVITHFPPCDLARNKYFEESMLTAYFQADCRSIIEEYQPGLWAYGHNHYSDEFQIGKTRVVSNQLGYPHEGYLPGYDPLKVLEV